MAAPFNAVAFGTMYIVGNSAGWSERYPIAGTGTLIGQNNKFIELCNFRRLILGGEYNIRWARTSLGDSKRQRKRAISRATYPFNTDTEAGPPILIASSNALKDALLIEFETSDGEWNTRLYRGIRDGWISGDDITFTPTVPATVVAGVNDVAGLTREAALGNWIRAVMQYTDRCVESPAGSGVLVRSPWVDFVIRGVTTRKTGKAFGVGRGRAPATPAP